MTAPASIFDTMASRPASRLDAQRALGDGVDCAIWRNRDDAVRYAGSDRHTVSLYLSGGEGNRRLDSARDRAGHSGSFCLMPQGSHSDWVVPGAVVMLHLYLPDHVLRRMLAEDFDRDPAALSVPEIDFGDDPRLAAVMRRLVGFLRDDALLDAQGAAQAIAAHLLSDPGIGALRPVAAKGGLSPRQDRLIRDYLDAHLASQITLTQLSDLVGLSPGHLQRQFRARHGVSPQQYLTARRVDRAEAMLLSGAPLAEIAPACGFSHQSHLTRQFRRLRGAPPAAWLEMKAVTRRTRLR